MPKAKTRYVCNSCGESHAAWSGRCSVCGEWNTIQQFLDIRGTSKAELAISSGVKLEPRTLTQQSAGQTKDRLIVNLVDLDGLLGGGLVPGSVTLLAGQPGIGKSTLLLQIAHAIAKKNSMLYVSGEESPEQVAMRAKRLFQGDDDILVVASNSANDIAKTIAGGDYKVVIVDSIQTVATEEITGVPGAVSQVTNSAQLITAAAKRSSTAVILVGHVTKEGSIAGPKVLEHLVDVVLYLEGDRYAGFRVLRSVKNRFGSTNEAIILEMTDKGLSVVANPSAALLAERKISDGSVVVATLEGTRPILVEVQALVNTTSYGYPKRAASGFDLNRLNLLVAMLERRTKLRLADKDIYINIVGGIKISENAADLAVCIAIASAAKGMQLNNDAVVFGEVGLSGEIRHVPWLDKRVHEAKKMGFQHVIGPRIQNKSKKMPIDYLEATDVRAVLNMILTKG